LVLRGGSFSPLIKFISSLVMLRSIFTVPTNIKAKL